MTSPECRACPFPDSVAALELVRLREGIGRLDFTQRRLGMAFPDPWREGWNAALEVAQADLRALLDDNQGDSC